MKNISINTNIKNTEHTNTKTNNIRKKDYYEEITNKIIKVLESNTRPWVQPWDGGGVLPIPMRHNNTAYQGINTLILWQEAGEGGYNSPYWMTFKQAKILGGNVKKGQTATTIFYAGSIAANNDNKENEEGGGNSQDSEPNKSKTQKPLYRKFMKSYKVFNANQVDNLPEGYYKPLDSDNINISKNTDELESLPKLEEFIKNTKANIKHGGIKAYYKLSTDYIQMPEMKLFKNSNAYYSTICHELIHWSGSTERLNRNLGGKRFGDAGYAMEELVAELGAAFLSSSLGIVPDVREDHAPYIASWLKVLKSDKRAIFNAASLAQAASNYLLELGNKNTQAK